MAPVEGQPSVFSVIVHLPPGCVDQQLLHGARSAPPRYHQYKFIVDGEWRHDETQPYMPDPLGNVNNWLFVRRPDSTPTPNTCVLPTPRICAPYLPHSALPNAPFLPTEQQAEPPASPAQPQPTVAETPPDATPRVADIDMEPAEGSATTQDTVPPSIQAV